MNRKLKIATIAAALAWVCVHSTAHATLLPLLGGVVQTTTQTLSGVTSTVSGVTTTALGTTTAAVVETTVALSGGNLLSGTTQTLSTTTSSLLNSTTAVLTSGDALSLTTGTISVLNAQLQSTLLDGLATTLGVAAVLTSDIGAGTSSGGLTLSTNNDLCLSANVSLGGSGGGSTGCALQGGVGDGTGRVPEPATGLLLALAIGGVAWTRRRT